MGWRVPGLTSRAEMRSRVSSEQLEWGGDEGGSSQTLLKCG